MIYCWLRSGQLSSSQNPITLKQQMSSVYIYSVLCILQGILGYYIVGHSFVPLPL